LRESALASVPDVVAAAALVSWAALCGLVCFELFGQFVDVIPARGAVFAHAVATLGRMAGFPA
ncbi:MAG: WHG domain-containing protein, partial [Streptosporangiales bacterium]